MRPVWAVGLAICVATPAFGELTDSEIDQAYRHFLMPAELPAEPVDVTPRLLELPNGVRSLSGATPTNGLDVDNAPAERPVLRQQGFDTFLPTIAVDRLPASGGDAATAQATAPMSNALAVGGATSAAPGTSLLPFTTLGRELGILYDRGERVGSVVFATLPDGTEGYAELDSQGRTKYLYRPNGDGKTGTTYDRIRPKTSGPGASPEMDGFIIQGPEVGQTGVRFFEVYGKDGNHERTIEFQPKRASAY